MKKATSLLCIVFAVIMVLALPVSAASSYHTYTYSIAGEPLRSPDAYTPDTKVDASYMGLNDLTKLAELYPNLTEEELKAKAALATSSISDMVVDEFGNVYLVDSADKGRIIVLDSYYKLKFIIDEFKTDGGNTETLKKPGGVFVTSSKIVNGEKVDGRIFVCDTGNARILIFDINGNFEKEIGKPDSSSVDTFNPRALAVDRYDRLYVVTTSDKGIMIMTEEGEFTGFIGAQKVSVSLWDKIWMRFKTEEQKQEFGGYIATIYNNITLAGDFIYVTIELDNGVVENAIRNKDKSGDSAPVKMLNAAGKELMRRNGFYPPSGEVDTASAITATGDAISGASQIVDVAKGPHNTWSIIDKKRSKVFTYDFDGNLLFAYGDKGDLLGNISENSLTSIAYQGSNILLLDTNVESSFTVYKRTEYGDVLLGAIEKQNNRQYDEAIEDWTQVLMRNSNFDAAYIGIGNALYRSYDYKGAIEQFKSAYDTANYSLAYKELRQNWISTYLWTLPIGAFVIIFALMKFAKLTKKVNKRAETATGKRTYVEELLFSFHLLLHPFDGFWDLKHEKRGSVRAGTTILGITIIAFYYNSVGAGYVSNPQGNYMGIIGAVTSVAVPLALWIIGNWCLTTLFDGEGSMKDIYIASTYSLLPIILTTIPATIMSNFIVDSEVKTVGLISTLGLVWLGMLLFFGTMVTHDYSIGKNVLTVLATVFAMIAIMFIAILFSTLLGKLVGFVTNIITELRYRM